MSGSNRSKAKSVPDRIMALQWDINDADLIIFGEVCRGGNPLIAQRQLMRRGFTRADAQDLLKLALNVADGVVASDRDASAE